jgi:hypothetical protein
MDSPFSCPDHGPSSFGRRGFLKTAALAAATTVAGRIPLLGEASRKPTSETLVATFHKSLSAEQRGLFCLPFDHPLRLQVDNNWFITKGRLGKDLSRDQQQMVREIFLGLHSPEYAERVLKATEHDSEPSGLGACSVAVFGEPGTGKFEFVLTGRHVTRRCDGDSVEGAAFGGPIFYGHQAGPDDEERPDHPDNVYWYQAKRANEVFQMLDGKQRSVALVDRLRREHATETVKLTGLKTGQPGIPLRDLSRDQRDHVRKVMADLLAPFRKADADEAMKLVEANGFEDLHLAFSKSGDLGGDGVWDVWQIEGPAMLWYFRGSPHVHSWVNIRRDAGA